MERSKHFFNHKNKILYPYHVIKFQINKVVDQKLTPSVFNLHKNSLMCVFASFFHRLLQFEIFYRRKPISKFEIQINPAFTRIHAQKQEIVNPKYVKRQCQIRKCHLNFAVFVFSRNEYLVFICISHPIWSF